MSLAPWSPSLAREAARAALCRLRTQVEPQVRLEEQLVRLLADDRAFDAPEVLRRATWLPPEVVAILEIAPSDLERATPPRQAVRKST